MVVHGMWSLFWSWTNFNCKFIKSFAMWNVLTMPEKHSHTQRRLVWFNQDDVYIQNPLRYRVNWMESSFIRSRMAFCSDCEHSWQFWKLENQFPICFECERCTKLPEFLNYRCRNCIFFQSPHLYISIGSVPKKQPREHHLDIYRDRLCERSEFQRIQLISNGRLNFSPQWKFISKSFRLYHFAFRGNFIQHRTWTLGISQNKWAANIYIMWNFIANAV